MSQRSRKEERRRRRREKRQQRRFKLRQRKERRERMALLRGFPPSNLVGRSINTRPRLPVICPDTALLEAERRRIEEAAGRWEGTSPELVDLAKKTGTALVSVAVLSTADYLGVTQDEAYDIDSSKPYVAGNIQWIHKVVNLMKSVRWRICPVVS